MDTRTPVTVIGLGPMGQAMTRSLLDGGHPVTVWNRTRSRTEALAAAGATVADAVSGALDAPGPVILSLTDYQAMYDVLSDSVGSLGGKTLVNLSSDSPARTREAARWAATHGAVLLAGGVMVPAPMVGTEESYVFYSGERGAFEEYVQVLATIGTPRYVGEDPALAQLMYQAHLDVFLTTLSALAHATVLLRTAGMSASEVMPDLLDFIRTTPEMVTAGESLWEQIDADEHPGDLSTVTMMGATADHIVAASEEAGIDLTLPRAVQGHYRRAIEEGHGSDNWTRILAGIGQPR